MPAKRTPKKRRQRYQEILLELQNGLRQATPKSENELDQSLNYAHVTEEDLRSLFIVYKVMLGRTSEEIRQRYQETLFELQNRLLQVPPKSENELSQSLNVANVAEEDLRALSKAYKVLLDECPPGTKKCCDGGCIDINESCPPDPPGGW